MQLCVLMPVLCVQESAGLLGVLAVQPVLVEGVQAGVVLGKTHREAAVRLLHLLDQGPVRPARRRIALRLAAAAQTPWQTGVID